MKLKEKKGTEVPHALSVKLCMRSHGCTSTASEAKKSKEKEEKKEEKK